jgi:hypothetical protein
MAIDNPYDGEVIDGAMNFQKEGDSRICTTKSYRQVDKSTGRQFTKTRTRTETRTERSTEKSTDKSTSKSTKSTKILFKPAIESARIKSTGWSPKRTSNDDYRVKQHLRVNATY